jgi:hypothetical protein
LGRGEDGERQSKDKVEKAKGKRLVEWIEETVIDYGIVNAEAWERVEEVRIGETISKKL